MSDTPKNEAVALLREILAELQTLNATILRRQAGSKARSGASAAAKADKALTHQGRAESAPKALDACLVALCEIEGSDPATLTASALASLQHALTELRAACRTLTPQEIKERAGRFRRKNPTWTLTAHSLAKHWAKLAGMPARVVEVPPEPRDWAMRFVKKYGLNGWTKLNGEPQRVSREQGSGYQILRWKDLGSPSLGSLWKEFL